MSVSVNTLWLHSASMLIAPLKYVPSMLFFGEELFTQNSCFWYDIICIGTNVTNLYLSFMASIQVFMQAALQYPIDWYINMEWELFSVSPAARNNIFVQILLMSGSYLLVLYSLLISGFFMYNAILKMNLSNIWVWTIDDNLSFTEFMTSFFGIASAITYVFQVNSYYF